MQPEKGKREKFQTNVARARMLMKQNMEWIPGSIFMPPQRSGEQTAKWIYFSNDRQLKEKHISREDIRLADSTVKKLIHRFPRALPEIVTNVEQWQARMSFFLTICKAWVHDQQTPTLETVTQSDLLPARWVTRLNQLMREYPQMEAFLTTSAFLELTRIETTTADSLAWIKDNAKALSKFSVANHLDSRQTLSLQLSMLQAAAVTPIGLIVKLAETLTDSRAFAFPIENEFQTYSHYRYLFELRIEKKLRNLEPLGNLTPQAEKRPGQLGKFLLDFFAKTFGLKKRGQSSILQLLSLMLKAGFNNDVSSVKKGIDGFEKRWLRLLNQHEGMAPLPIGFSDDLEHLKTQTVAFETGAASVIKSTQEFVSALDLIWSAFAKPHESGMEWAAILEQMPDDLRVPMFCRWNRYLKYSPARRQDLKFVLGQVAILLKRHPTSATLILQYWRSMDSRFPEDFICETCDRYPDDRKAQSQTIRLLERIISGAPLVTSNDLLDSISSIAVGASNLEDAEKIFRLLAAEADLDVDEEEITLAKQFAKTIPQTCDLLKVEYEYRQPLEELTRLVSEPALRSAIVKAVLDKELSVLQQLRWVTLVLKHFGSIKSCIEQISLDRQRDARSEREGIESWMKHYPTEFHEKLVQLSSYAELPQEVASQILGKDIPDPQALQSEIDAIESKLKRGQTGEPELDSKLTKRIRKLKSYQKAPLQISPQRILNLTNKLEARIQHEAIARYTKLGRKIVKTHFQDTPNAERVLESLMNAKFGPVLAEILSLNSPNQKLGLRLLFETEAGSTGCFEAEPQNQAFLDSIRAKGVDTAPWISAESWKEETKDGQAYTLAFTDEALDYLLMGFHFKTCLSPGDTNFFSTIANAVDVNKKVLYAKTAEGKVLGRCLFAINSRGQILTFHRYQHDEKSQFSAAVDSYAKVLAKKMGTSLTSQGVVPNLVAPEWYNDGAVAGEPGYFSSFGAVDRAIEAAPREEKLAALLKLTDRFEILERLQEVLNLAKYSDCKQFQRDLLNELKRETKLTLQQRIRMASFAFSQKLNDFIPDILTGQKLKGVIRCLNQDYCCDSCNEFRHFGSYLDVFGMLIELNPTWGLRSLRGTRAAAVEEDEQEGNLHRRRMLAQAHRKLGRVTLAEKLCPKKRTSTSSKT